MLLTVNTLISHCVQLSGEWQAGASKRRGGAAIHEHCVEFNGKGWVLQQLVVKQKVKLITGSSEFIHE
jgi:hypothetical protein